jgi:2-methylcitrate dehydratase PrpD
MGSFAAATVLGQKGNLKLSLLDAAVANGQMGHVLDFDDTHLGGVILHTSTATLPALFALGEARKVTGKTLMLAMVAAFEAGIRTGQAMPRHHHGGWHLTGTLGTVAASAGSAKLLGLDAQQTIYALGIGCTQAAGMQQNRGSDCKSLHAGKSAYHGVLAAMLASNGFNSSAEILDGSLGFVRIYSSTQNLPALTAELGKSWLITGNGYKPYACGVVLHPLIDAAIEVSRKAKIKASEVSLLEITVHPDVIRITGVDAPGSGLMSKFSANHAGAVAFVDQAAGIVQFSNERARDPAVQALRKRVQIKASDSLRLDQAFAKITTQAGAIVQANIEHATGTVANPIDDQDLERKFLGNAEPVLGATQAAAVAKQIWELEQLADVGDLVRLCG